MSGGCVVCGKPRRPGRRYYCSMKCRDEDAPRRNSTRRFDKECATCGGSFVASDGRARYCSARCRGFAAKDGIEGFLRHLLKHRSRSKTLPLEYMVEMYWRQGGKCAISGVKMTIEFGNGRVMTNMSIDRIDSGRGYEPDNVQLVCLAVNLMKLDMTEVELNAWCSWIALNVRHRLAA